MYKYILLALVCPLVQFSYSQDKQFPKLEKLLSQGKYEKLLKKADAVARDKKNAKEPLPHYYKAKALIKLEGNPAKEYKRAAEQSLKSALTFKRKDAKKQLFQDRLDELRDEIRPVALEKAVGFKNEGNCFKAIRVYDDLINLKHDPTAMALKGECLQKSPESQLEGKNLQKAAITGILRNPKLSSENPQMPVFFARQAKAYYDIYQEDSTWLLFRRAVEIYPEDKELYRQYTDFLIQNTSFIKNWYTTEQLEELMQRADHALKYYPKDPRLLEYKRLLYLSQIDNYVLELKRDKALEVYARLAQPQARKDVSNSILELISTYILPAQTAEKESAFTFLMAVNNEGKDADPARSIQIVSALSDSLIVQKRYREVQELIRLGMAKQGKESPESKELKLRFEQQLLAESAKLDTSMASLEQLKHYEELAGGSVKLKKLGYDLSLALLRKYLNRGDFSAFAVSYRTISANNPGKPELKEIKKQFVLADYRHNYLGTSVSDSMLRWNGFKMNCYQGTVSDSAKLLFQRRLAFFRRQAGLQDSIIFDSIMNVNCQSAAMMMFMNNALSHEPPKNWKCYTPFGAEGAGTSNLSLGYHSTAALTGQMEDEGTQNYSVGHRRWILNPYRTVFGHGSTPNSMALGVFGKMSRQSTRLRKNVPDLKENEFVAWPPADFVMADLVFRRWSFSIDGADFTQSRIILSVDKKNIPVSIEPLSLNTYGLNTIVWYITQGSVQPGKTYQVTVKDVKLRNGKMSDFSYQVTLLQ